MEYICRTYGAQKYAQKNHQVPCNHIAVVIKLDQM